MTYMKGFLASRDGTYATRVADPDAGLVMLVERDDCDHNLGVFITSTGGICVAALNTRGEPLPQRAFYVGDFSAESNGLQVLETPLCIELPIPPLRSV